MTTAAQAGRHRAPGADLPKAARTALNDALYRGSALLLANILVLSMFGFLFWAVAARTHHPQDVGAFSALASGVNLLTTVAAVGIPNLLLRYLKGSIQQRTLLATSLLSVATIGAIGTLATVAVLRYTVGDALSSVTGTGTVTLAALVTVNACSAAIDAGLVAVAAHRVLLGKNLVGGLTKLAILPIGAVHHSNALVAAYATGTIVAAAVAVTGLLRLTTTDRHRRLRDRRLQRRSQRHFSTLNYLGTIFGILPTTVVPLIVIANRGATEAAWFSVAALLASFLNAIPAATGQVLFAQSGGTRLTSEGIWKALRVTYMLLLPSSFVVFAFAPYILVIFGDRYADEATWCLRALVASAVVGATNYIIDSTIIAQDGVGWYVLLNAMNAALVLGGVTTAVSHGLAVAAAAYATAQLLSALIGAAVLMHTRRQPLPAPPPNRREDHDG